MLIRCCLPEKNVYKNIYTKTIEQWLIPYQSSRETRLSKIYRNLMFPYYPATMYHLKCQWRRPGVFIVNFEYISHLVLVFLLLTLCR